jgi:PAS domain S-box-containing protein
MHRRPKAEVVESQRRSQSGVRRAVAPQLFDKLKLDLEAAAERARELRTGITQYRDTTSAMGDGDLGLRALQEIDTAHEELHVLEEELHAQADEILATRESFDRERRIYSDLFEAAPEAYLVTDEQGTVIQANRRASTLFNLEPCFLVGKPLASLFAAEDRPAFRDVVGAMNEAVFGTELRIQPRGDAARRWIALSAQRGVRDESSICIRWLMRDITAQKEEEALRIANEELLRNRVRELEASHAALGKLLEREQTLGAEAVERARGKEYVLTEVAHELRTPLGAIAGWLHVLSDQAGSDAIARNRAVLSMARSVREIVRLVEQLLEHARLSHHQVKLEASPLNLLRVVIEVMEDLRPLAELKNIRMELAAKQYKVEINGDAFRLRQVFRNLIGNAIKFTPEQGTVRVGVSMGHQAEVKVADTGRGIAREGLPRLFTPFAQLGPNKRQSGLGLGLSIARRLVELHGGTIHADSEGAQRGATFRVRLPLFAPN